MAAGQHNPSRRALLGAAVAIPLITTADGAGVATGPLHPPSPSATAGPPPRSAEEWNKALAAFEKAQATVWKIEAATAGYGFEDEEPLLPAHDAACEAMEVALRRMLFVPAPDVAGFAAKLDLFFEHGLEPRSAEEEVLAAVRRDVRWLAATG
jgi:cobalamin biosynthesis protein CbiG